MTAFILDPGSPIGTWMKKTAIFGAAFGIAAMLTMFAIFGLLHWYGSRPKPWNAETIRSISTTATQSFTLDEKANSFTGTGFDLAFVVENRTASDYTVPQDLKLFKRNRRSLALEEFNAKLEHPFMIPAKERAEIQAEVEYGCNTLELETGKKTERDAQTCFNDAFGDVAGFVGFDYETRTRLNLLNPELYRPNGAPQDSLTGIAPDRGKPWERYADCQEGERLVALCNQANIRAVQISGMVNFVSLILLDKRVLGPGTVKPGWA
jgi:hypothetical protein